MLKDIHFYGCHDTLLAEVTGRQEQSQIDEILKIATRIFISTSRLLTKVQTRGRALSLGRARGAPLKVHSMNGVHPIPTNTQATLCKFLPQDASSNANQAQAQPINAGDEPLGPHLFPLGRQ